MHRWYVVQTKPNQEFKAEVHLKRQNFQTWLPQFKKTRRHARRTDEVSAPLFPGYLFVRMNTDACRWRSINGTYGVQSIISNGPKPTAVCNDFMDDLQESAVDGVYFTPPDPLKTGDEIEISGGAFENYTGTIVGMSARDRVMVLITMLGREVKAMIPRQIICSAT